MKKTKYKYSRSMALAALGDQSMYNGKDAQRDHEKSIEFIHNAFDEYEGKDHHIKAKFAFAIPTRASKHNNDYWEETYDFLPALRHIEPRRAFQVLAHLPPFIVGEYGHEDSPTHGVIIFVPIFADMVKDYRTKLTLARSVYKRINDSVDFAHNTLGVQYIGLGATLPKLTKFGRLIKANVHTTTGHAGTVWLLTQTFEAVLKRKKLNTKGLKVGVVGCVGSIAKAAMLYIASNHPEIELYGSDIRQQQMEELRRNMLKNGLPAYEIVSNKELIDTCDIIISAVTATIDVSGMNLKRKVFIDDSQPGSFVKEQIESGGGELIWVVGHDRSSEKFVTRKKNYKFGPHGLAHRNDLWGCEAEVAVIAKYNEHRLTVSDHVTKQQIDQIGQLFDKAGIDIAEFQSYGSVNS